MRSQSPFKASETTSHDEVNDSLPVQQLVSWLLSKETTDSQINNFFEKTEKYLQGSDLKKTRPDAKDSIRFH